MSWNVELKFRVPQTVKIKALEKCEGWIRMVRIHIGGEKDYLVSYWSEGIRREEWIPEHDLEQA